MRRFILTIIIVSLFLFVFYLIYPIEICRAGDTIHVYSGESIQDAINTANESDVIYVHSGTYNENLIIDKNIILTGTGSESVTISGSDDHTIKVNNNSVEISDFTIKNTDEDFRCIFLNSVTNCLITNNVIKDGGNGIYIENSNINTIKDNTVESNNIGIYFFNSDSNTIKNNNIQNNMANGIWLTSSSTNNIFYLNDFSNNPDSNAKDYGSNNWDYGSQGNYWDDYNDYDSNEDGIGDNPYIIPGNIGNQDNFPLGDFLSLNEQPVAYIDSISPNPGLEGQTVNFNGHGSDDGSIVGWEWKSNDVVISNSEDFSKSDFSAGTYTIKFRVKDNDDYWSAYVERILIICSINQKPIAYILEPTTALTKQYGESIQFIGQGSDDGQIVEYNWRSSIDNFLSKASQFIVGNLTVGQHTIYLKVKDNEGEWSSEVSIVVTIIPDPLNNPPVADAGGPYNGYVNQTLTVDGSKSYDPDNEDNISSYSWNFGDGTTGEGVSAEHIYTSEGSYTIELTVTDSNGEQNKSIAYATISIKANGQNGGTGDDNKTPGFEIIYVFITIIFILCFKMYKKNKKKN